MDFKHSNDKCDKHMTPKTKVNILTKRISCGITTESPFRNLPNFSTPPSRFSKIINPFEPHLIERLHLPTFSPNVFVQNSTPKTEQKFRWTIDDISHLKPVDIDETTVSQHICTTDDPRVESLVQQKIETFFSEKAIVPSPMNVKSNIVPHLKDCFSMGESPEKASVRSTTEGATQTVLTLPPILPKELEEALKPYFTFNDDQQQITEDSMSNTSLYRQLFEYEDNEDEENNTSGHSRHDAEPLLSLPATDVPPAEVSPFSKKLDTSFDIPELKDCNLSPIRKNSPKAAFSKSVCRLDFSESMSVDVSLVVPDLDNQQMLSKSCFEVDNSFSPLRPSEVTIPESTVNWSMEDKHFSIRSNSSTDTEEKMDVSSSNTPHSKIFTGKGQRKRLSESFKNEEIGDSDNAIKYEDIFIKNRNKIFRNDLTDAGYHTQDTGDFSNNCTNVFASTPSKRSTKVEF